MDTDEASPFETSEMLATFLASTPLLSESWKLCSQANAAAPWSFTTEQSGGVVYVAFSGVQMAGGSDPSWGSLVAVDSIGDVTLFSSGRNMVEPVMVHAGMLNLFLSLFNSFQNQMFEIIKNTDAKSIVITGHSLGGAIASLCTIWFLSYLRSISSAISVLCITFGSPLLGNKSLYRAILKERWGGNFCHVVSKLDIMPRLLFAPLQPPLTSHLNFLLQFWHLSMTSLELRSLAVQISEQEIAELFSFVMAYLSAAAAAADGEGSPQISFHPFGSYVFVSEKGAVCVDSAAAVIQMMHLMFAPSSPSCSIDDHLKYGDYVNNLSLQAFKRSCVQENISDSSSYEAGLELALKSSGMASQGSAAVPVKESLRMARRMGRSPSLKHANLAVTLSKFVPYRAEIQWYKEVCDKAEDQLGYYDSFKRRGSSRRDMKINMNRLKLARFWNSVIEMMESNQLPYDFDRSRKWTNTSQFYKLLVEPLDIAEYYRKGMHKTKGHYIQHGRERRYEIFDRWWKEKTPSTAEGNYVRSTFASLTQDTCFWARVEEARDWLDSVKRESDPNKEAYLWDNIVKFENYAAQLIENKEVSKDVLAKNSSYSVWVEELKDLREMKAKVQNFPPQCIRFVNGGVIP